MGYNVADFQAVRTYHNKITFRGERISRREDDGTETEISREEYQAGAMAAEARQTAAHAAFDAENTAKLAAAQAEKAELGPAIARLRGKRKITLAEHDALNRMEERYQRVCMDEAVQLGIQDMGRPRRWPTPLDVSRTPAGKLVVKRSQR